MEDLRREIDSIDDGIAELFGRRMSLVKSVAEYKAERGLPVLNPDREREILDRVLAATDEELRDYAETLFKTLMDVSRAYQKILIKSIDKK